MAAIEFYNIVFFVPRHTRIAEAASYSMQSIGVARIFDWEGGSCKFSPLTSFTLDISHSPLHSVQFFYVTTRMRVQLKQLKRCCYRLQ